MHISVYVASALERDDPFVEIAVDNEIFCEVSKDDANGPIVVEIFQRVSGADWIWDLDELLRALNAAKARVTLLMS